MNRLVTKTDFGVGTLADLIVKDRFIKILEKLYKYEELEEQGLLIKLPPITKEDTLYWIWGDKIMPVKLEEIDTGVTYKMTTKEDRTFTKINGGKFTYEKGNVRFFYSDDFGKTVFLTREEAEKALEEMNENK